MNHFKKYQNLLDASLIDTKTYHGSIKFINP